MNLSLNRIKRKERCLEMKKDLFRKMLSMLLIAAVAFSYIPLITLAEETGERVDLALNKSSAASSSWSSNYTSAKAFDGDRTATRWSAARNAVDNQFLMVDLGAAYDVEQFTIIQYQDRVEQWSIELSSDGTVWNQAASGDRLSGDKAVLDIVLESKMNGRYVRLNMVHCSVEPSIYAFEVYNMKDESGTTPPPTQMTLSDFYSAVTPEEYASYVDYLNYNYPPANTTNLGNALAYGGVGLPMEAMGLMYEETRDTALINLMIRGAERILLGRNDQANGDGRTLFTGNVEKAWPNSEAGSANAGYAGPENGDITGHMAYTAQLILETPSLWNEAVPDGDSNGWGATYLQRAQTYLVMCEEVLQEFLVPCFIDPVTKKQYFPDTPGWNTETSYADRAGDPIPWNQQWMMNYGFMHQAAALEKAFALGFGPSGAFPHIAQYRQMVQTSADWFISDLTPRKAGPNEEYDVYYWTYWPSERGGGGKAEDANDAHMAYDLAGMHMAITHDYANVSAAQMQIFANTLKYVIYLPGNEAGVFAGSVDGTQGKAYKNTLWPQCYFLGLYDEASYGLMTTQAFRNSASQNPSYFGLILYMKARLFGVEDGL